MRIKSTRLQDYKRFIDLPTADLPQIAKLVASVGPSETSKSSIFDSLLLVAGAAVSNFSPARNWEFERYYEREAN